jgi:hypothetical protein
MPHRVNVKRKLTKHGYVQDIIKSDDRCDYWTDCVGNGRDIRYDWDSAEWVGQFSILGKEGNCRWENLNDITLDELFGGMTQRRLTLLQKLDRDGDLAHSIIKAIKLSREGR